MVKRSYFFGTEEVYANDDDAVLCHSLGGSSPAVIKVPVYGCIWVQKGPMCDGTYVVPWDVSLTPND